MFVKKYQTKRFLLLFVMCGLGIVLSISGCNSRMRTKRCSSPSVCAVPVKTQKTAECAAQKKLTKQEVESSLSSFCCMVDQACDRYKIASRVPSCFLSNLNKRRIKLGPYLKAFNAKRGILVKSLVTPESL